MRYLLFFLSLLAVAQTAPPAASVPKCVGSRTVSCTPWADDVGNVSVGTRVSPLGHGEHTLLDTTIGGNSVNVRAGYVGNSIAAGVYASSILSGGNALYAHGLRCTLGSIQCGLMTIVGGYDNVMDSAYPSVIGGGAHNRINVATTEAGYNPAVPGFTPNALTNHATVAGGSFNAIYNSLYGTISGGSENSIGSTTTSDGATIGGGLRNIVNGNYSFAVGQSNTIACTNCFAFGYNNQIVSAGVYGGTFGYSNKAVGTGSYALGGTTTAWGSGAMAWGDGVTAFSFPTSFGVGFKFTQGHHFYKSAAKVYAGVSVGSVTTTGGVYKSGGTITGTAGQTCTLTSFDGDGGTGAASTLTLTGANTIAADTAMVMTNVGSGYTSPSGTATLGNGTATCSGTAIITTNLGAQPFSVSAAGVITAAGGSTGRATCWKASGVIGYCSSAIDSSGACTCN